MNLYLNYFREELNTEGDTEPIGIVLGAYEDKLMVKYATQNISNQLFVSRYQLYLPNKEQLEQEVRRFLKEEQIKVYDASIKIQLVIFLEFLGKIYSIWFFKVVLILFRVAQTRMERNSILAENKKSIVEKRKTSTVGKGGSQFVH